MLCFFAVISSWQAWSLSTLTCVACCTHIFQFLGCCYVFNFRGWMRERQYGELFRDSLSRKLICAGWSLCICPHQPKLCYEDVSFWLNFFPYTIYSHCHGVVVFGHGSMAFGFVYTNLYFIFQQAVFSRRLCLVSASTLGVGVSGRVHSCRNMVEMVC